MVHVVTILGLVVPMLVAAAFLLGRQWHRRPRHRDELSPVTRQHIDLFQGGQLNDAAVEMAKARFRSLFERGDLALAEASLQPGTQYVVQVRALTELGSDAAGRILERQLHRRLTSDPLEQSWYWIDLAGGLRNLNREQSLPHVLRCSEAAGVLPLGHFFAAETVCFVGFNTYLRHCDRPLGAAALRMLHRALEGLRFGVQPQVIVEARLGEAVEYLWDHRPDTVHPMLVRIFSEALRQVRRAPHAEVAFGEETAEREAFQWQMARISALEPLLEDYLREAPYQLRANVSSAPPSGQSDILAALDDLRVETANVVLPLLENPRFQHRAAAIRLLLWSKDAGVGPWLREWIGRHVPVMRRAQRRRRADTQARPSVPESVPYAVALRALRAHPSRETEILLLLAAHDWDPTFRLAAAGSLGWWEPMLRAPVLNGLQELRRDPNADVRQAARAALARLGERQALNGFRLALTSEDRRRVHEAVESIAAEGLTLLWPDLDRLADAEDADVAYFAREALERLCENLDSRPV
jgi:hypothetical protein